MLTHLYLNIFSAKFPGFVERFVSFLVPVPSKSQDFHLFSGVVLYHHHNVTITNIMIRARSHGVLIKMASWLFSRTHKEKPSR